MKLAWCLCAVEVKCFSLESRPEMRKYFHPKYVSLEIVLKKLCLFCFYIKNMVLFIVYIQAYSIPKPYTSYKTCWLLKSCHSFTCLSANICVHAFKRKPETTILWGIHFLKIVLRVIVAIAEGCARSGPHIIPGSNRWTLLEGTRHQAHEKSQGIL